jgi:hypothetical protein
MSEMSAPLPPTPPALPQEPPGGQSSGVTLNYAVHAIVAALAAWLGGAALSEGWGVHLPFAPTWILLLTGLLTAEHVSDTVARAWHREKVKAAPRIAAANEAARLYVATMGPAILAHLNGSQGK